MAEMEIKQKRILKATLTRFGTFLSHFNADEDNVEELKIRLKKITGILDDFIGLQCRIATLEDDNVQLDEELVIFENSYFSVIATANTIINERAARLSSAQGLTDQHINARQQSIQTNGQSVVDVNTTAAGVKLPTINIPTFSGAYDTWLIFRDTYKSLIHDNVVLSNIQKFHYLRSSLTNEAAEQIHSLETTNDNYVIAWELLQERYENSGLIINSHINAIFDLPTLTQESYIGIRQIHLGIERHLRSLKALGLPVEGWDMIIINIIMSKLDSVTLRDWKGVKLGGKLPTMKEMLNFLLERCQMLQDIKNDKIKGNLPKTQINSTRSRQPCKTFLAADVGVCHYCKGSHSVYACPSLIGLSINSRIQESRKRKLCLNCLKKGHNTRDCRSSLKCQKCGKRHHTLLHLEATTEASDRNPVASNTDITATSALTACSSISTNKRTLLATALVIIKDNNGKSHECRALLDSASQSNFLTEGLCDKLNLSAKPIRINVSGIGQGQTRINKRVNVVIHSRLNAFKANLSCLVLPNITDNIPATSFDCDSLNIPEDLRLADPEFHESSQIDLLIGASLFWDLLCQGQVRLGRDLPSLQKTHFGWIVSGPLTIHQQIRNTLCHIVRDDNIDIRLRKFWEVEERYFDAEPSPLFDNICEKHFKETTRRDSNGRFVVYLPFKTDKEITLGESKEIAIKRFLSLERKLARDEDLKSQYHQFINDYIVLGHMTKIDDVNSQGIVYYIPHHPVLKPSSLTTRLRVVFDASAKTTNGKSLNDMLLPGPTIQNDLFTILLRFRKYRFVITADVAKMYRQVLITETQRSLQRIIWRFEPNHPLEIYELNTATYGTTPASYLVIRCLFELASTIVHTLPKISRIITNDFYVDDLLTGANTLEELKYFQRELTCVLRTGGFELRKWSSNNSEFLKEIQTNEGQETNFVIGMAEDCKTLGLLWNPKSDILFFSVNLSVKGALITKRQILSCIAQIFDPLGFLTPFTTIVKIILQKLWQLKLSWDESIPLDLRTRWLSLRDSLPAIDEIKISRHVFCINPVNIQVHAFCDASEAAYGACVYIRSCDQFSNCTVRLLTSKSRVAPLKRLSIPRLELCGAVILSQLVLKIRESLEISVDSFYFWTDSTIALAWIRACPSKWKTFVANRVSEIQSNVGSNWYHINGIENPADLLSRGLDPVSLRDSQLWWNGPPWLKLSIDKWPSRETNTVVVSSIESLAEERVVTLITTEQANLDLFGSFSKFSTLRRVVAYCLRYIRNSRLENAQRITGELNTKELLAATFALSKYAQREFSSEISILNRGHNLPAKSKLLPLSPFWDEGLLRVGGRLKNSNFDYMKKHPILLPRGHISRLIIQHEHERLCHAGPQAVLASLRETFWPIAGRTQVRGVIKKCVKCCRAEPKSTAIFMGDLPASRLAPTRPFLRTGVDYAGPFAIKDRKTRGAKLTKAYVCLFVCFSTRAIHLELVGDLTMEAFVATLRRFVSRRGKPSDIYSDNGTNFVGANRELSELSAFLKTNEKSITSAACSLDIQWHFIPPRSPHFGGLWEAGVKSMKMHLKRVLANASLNYEEFYTILVQIEACLNSRPLSPLSNDPNDLLPLTPAHFLIGESLKTVPDPDLSHIAENRLAKFQRMQLLVQHFWKRWSVEYISELQIRSKWRTKEEPRINVGSLVILKEDNIAPVHWKLARVVEIHKGNDNIARVATVRTSLGLFKRAMAKLCPLPIDN